MLDVYKLGASNMTHVQRASTIPDSAFPVLGVRQSMTKLLFHIYYP